MWVTLTRIVKRGRPNALYRLTVTDLPADFDLRQSHFRYVDASGLDLSAYDCRHTDWIHCVCDNIILPDNRMTDNLYSRNSTWTGAQIPADISSLNHDVVQEVIRQAIPGLRRTRARQMMTFCFNWMNFQYSHSWSNAIWTLINLEGYTLREVSRFAGEAFQGYLQLLDRLRNATLPDRSRSRLVPTLRPHIRPVLVDGGRETRDDGVWPNSLRAAWMLEDRYLAAREIETWMDATRPQGAPWLAAVFAMGPIPVEKVEPGVNKDPALHGDSLWWTRND